MTYTETKEIQLADLPQPPDGACFSLQKIETRGIPHPYCITTGHVVMASDHYNGMLGEEAIEAAERAGTYCDICRQLAKDRGERILTYAEHESLKMLFIKVPHNTKLKSVEGLEAYLCGNKSTFEALGIQGFAFPTK